MSDADRGVQIAPAEFKGGIVGDTTVAPAQETLLTSHQSVLNVLEARLRKSVSLFGDLGGDWQSSRLSDPRRREKSAAPDLVEGVIRIGQGLR